MLCLLVSKADVICLADVNALYVYGRCYSQDVDVIPLLFEWHMLLPFVLMANVVAIFIVLENFLCFSILQL